MARFLEVAVEAKLNIIISGGTGTGKTTLLNILSGFLGEDERIITIEDAAELKLHQNHVISLETNSPILNSLFISSLILSIPIFSLTDISI